MREASKLPFVLALVGILSLLGCDAFTNDVSAQPEPTVRRTESAAKPARVAWADKPAAPPARRPPPAGTARRLPPSSATPGTAVTRMPLPSGEAAGSAVLVEISAPREVLAGKEFDHKIILTNLTSKALTGVVLTETVPKNLKVSGAAPEATVAGQVLKWAVGKLAAREAKTFVIRGAATTTGPLAPCCQVTYDIPEVCVAIRAVQPALRIVKTAPAEVILCDPIPIKIVVTNTGSGMAHNVKVTDPLPEGMKTADGKGAVAFDAGSLAPGQSRAFAIQAKASKTGKFVNKATVTADGGLQAVSPETTTLVKLPVLAVTKTGPQMRYVGRPLTYTITVTNKGDAVAKDTVLVDTLPTNAKFLQASEGGKSSAGKVTWALGTLAPNASKTVTISLMATTMGTVRNVATATAYCAKAAAQAATIVKGIPAILLECVDVQDPIELGSQDTYVITVTNQGSALGTGIVIKCTLPAEQGFVSATGPTKETVDGKDVTFAPLKSLAPKAKATYRVTIKGIGVGDTRFKVSLTSDQMDSPAEETESTHIYK